MRGARWGHRAHHAIDQFHLSHMTATVLGEEFLDGHSGQ